MYHWVFIPFVIQTFSCVVYFSYYLQQAPEDNEGWFFPVILAICVYVTTIYFAWLESLQIKSNKTYFFELTNYIDIGSAILNIVLMVKHDFFYDKWYGYNT